MTAVLLVVFSSRHWRLLSVGQLYTMLLFRNFCSYTEYTLMYPNLTFLKWYTRYFEKKRSYYSFILFIISLGIKVGTFLFVYLFFKLVYNCFGFPWWLSGKESACQTGDVDTILGLGRSPGEENPMDREAWQATDHGHERVKHNLATK